MALSKQEIQEIRDRCNRTTPGPWISFVEGRDMESAESFIRTKVEDIYLIGATIADQDFIAAARQDVPALLDEIERLRSELKRGK